MKKMKAEQYRRLWHTIVKSCKFTRKPFVPIHVFAALRLFSWNTIGDLTRPSPIVDGHERLLRSILMDDFKDPSTRSHLEQQFYKVIHEKPHSPLQALCLLYQFFPNLHLFLGVSPQKLDHLVTDHANVVAEVVPQTWPRRDSQVHFISLIRSIEIWLTAFYKISVPHFQ